MPHACIQQPTPFFDPNKAACARVGSLNYPQASTAAAIQTVDNTLHTLHIRYSQNAHDASTNGVPRTSRHSYTDGGLISLLVAWHVHRVHACVMRHGARGCSPDQIRGHDLDGPSAWQRAPHAANNNFRHNDLIRRTTVHPGCTTTSTPDDTSFCQQHQAK